MRGKILVTTRSFRKIEGSHQQLLRDAGYEIVNSPYERPLSAHELGDCLAGMDAAILGVDEVTAEAIARADRLRVISRFGVGVDRVDLAAATARRIVVTNTPGANSRAVAELTMALMLALARHIPQQNCSIRTGDWSPLSGMELDGGALGLIGLGRIGQEVARRAAGFGMEILYCDPLPPQEFPLSARRKSFDELLKESDFVSLHLPLTDETRHMIDRDALRKMKPSAFLINTARGGLVHEQDLYEALRAGLLAGAACDVFDHEPPGDHPLLRLDNFIATPHCGSATVQTTLRMGLMAARNALAVLRGERPADVVNPEVYEGDGG